MEGTPTPPEQNSNESLLPRERVNRAVENLMNVATLMNAIKQAGRLETLVQWVEEHPDSELATQIVKLFNDESSELNSGTAWSQNAVHELVNFIGTYNVKRTRIKTRRN